MIRSIVQLNLNVNYLEACENTILHSALDTCVNCRNVFLRNSTADNLVDELIALTGLVWLNVDLNVTVLTLTT